MVYRCITLGKFARIFAGTRSWNAPPQFTFFGTRLDMPPPTGPKLGGHFKTGTRHGAIYVCLKACPIPRLLKEGGWHSLWFGRLWHMCGTYVGPLGFLAIFLHHSRSNGLGWVDQGSPFIFTRASPAPDPGLCMPGVGLGCRSGFHLGYTDGCLQAISHDVP